MYVLSHFARSLCSPISQTGRHPNSVLRKGSRKLLVISCMHEVCLENTGFCRVPCLCHWGMSMGLSNAGLSLYGVDLQCSAAAAATKGNKKGQRAHRSAFLFTHRGYSGPSVLDLSHSVTKALERGTPLPSEPCLKTLIPVSPALIHPEVHVHGTAANAEHLRTQNLPFQGQGSQ